MKLLTWNLHSKPEHNQPPNLQTLNDVIAFLDHHAANDLVIGCIQEAPIAGAQLKKHVENLSPRLSCIPGDAKAHLIYARNLRVKFFKSDASRRAIISRFQTPTDSILYVVGLHLRDQKTVEHPAARGGACALFRANLDELTDPLLPVVVLGDFNVEPRSQEITSPFCFYARTSRDKVVEHHKKLTGKFRRPLFVKEPDGDGTIYYSSDEGWKTFDFMLVSSDLDKQFLSIKRCTDMMGKNLLTSSAKQIPTHKISDHLPVFAEMHFQ